MYNFLLADELNSAAATALWGVLVVLAIAIAIFSVWAFLAQIGVMNKYRRFNKVEASNGKTAAENTRDLLDKAGLTDIAVKKCGVFWEMFFGNSYSPRRKTIFLRRNVFNKTSITATALATQKVGLAVMDREGDKKFKARKIMLPLAMFAPNLFVPFIILGLACDVALFQNGSFLFTIIMGLIGLFFYLASFIYICLNIPVEKKANEFSLQIIRSNNLLTEEEIADVEIMYAAYIKMYIIQFILALLKVLYDVVKLILRIVIEAGKNSK